MSVATLIVTAYVATGHLCADGHQPKAGLTCATRAYPLGARVWIEGMGCRTVEDRTSPKYPNRVDIFMDSRAEALRFGKRKLKVWLFPAGDTNKTDCGLK